MANVNDNIGMSSFNNSMNNNMNNMNSMNII